MVLIAFDNTQQDDSTDKIVVRVETFDAELDYYVVYHIFYQCNVERKICMSELVKIDSPLGEREFSDDNVRISQIQRLQLTGAIFGASVGATFGPEILEWGAQTTGQIVGGARELITYF